MTVLPRWPWRLAVLTAASLLSAGLAMADGPSRDEPASGAPALAANERWVAPAEFLAAAERTLKPALQARGARVELSLPRDAVRGMVVDSSAEAAAVVFENVVQVSSPSVRRIVMYGRHCVVQQFVVQFFAGLQPVGKNTVLLGSRLMGS